MTSSQRAISQGESATIGDAVDRRVKAGAQVIAPNGRAFTDASIGMALAMRNLMADLREAGQMSGGPAGFSPRDRSNFLSALDNAVTRLKRAGLG